MYIYMLDQYDKDVYLYVRLVRFIFETHDSFFLMLNLKVTAECRCNFE